MRTTLELDDRMLRAARALAEQRGISLGAAVSELALRGLEAARVLEGEVAVEHLAAGRQPVAHRRALGAEHLGDRRLRLEESVPGGNQQVAGLVGRALVGRQVEQVLQHLVDHRAAHGVGRERLGQMVDGPEAVEQGTGHEGAGPARGERAEDVDPVDRGADPLGRGALCR
jgi:hypothetical protein